ncbi:MAG: MFS transporter [Clostridia bacterium]|nr:MFS transporter [Clostridia bacterium]
MTNEERKQICMKRNVKLHPFLNALTWDVIFVWTISTMFFYDVKNLSYSKIIALDSILMIFGCVMCVPVQRLLQNIKSNVAIRFGCLGYVAYLLLCIFGTNYATFILAQVFLAFGYCVMSVKINGVLTKSLSVLKRDKDYDKITGKGFSLYYVFESIGAIIITYVYNWNHYAAYWLSVAVALSALLISFFFTEPSKFQESNVSIKAEEQPVKNVKKPDSYLKIAFSGFFLSLLVYGLIFRGALSITGSSYRIYLNEVISWGALPAWLFGYLYAASRLLGAISSKFQFKFNLKFGVRSMLIINICIFICFFGTGILYLYNPTNIVCMVAIIILCCLSTALRMPHQIFVNNYMQVCVSKKNIERAYAIKTTVEYLGYGLISALYAGLLSAFKDNWGLTNIVYISILAIPLILSLIFFLKALIKKHAQKFTVVKDEYTKD